MSAPFRNARELVKVAGYPGLDLECRPALLDATVIEEVIYQDAYGLTTRPVPAIVVDLGAHVGVFSAFCAKLGSKRIVAVEPQPENLEMLHRNVEPWPAVEILQCAMGADDQGSTWIVGESGGAHTIDGANEGSEVETISLAGLLDALELEHVDLLKLDMEGGEVAALLACDHDHLARCQRIVLETHGPLLCPWVERPRVGEVLEHLLYTHNVEAAGYPTRLGKIFAVRNGVDGGW